MKVFETLPPASPRVGFYRTVSTWKDAAAVEFGPEGTMHYAQGTIRGDTTNLFTTGLREHQVIFGDTTNLEKAIRDIDCDKKPRLLIAVSSPVSEIIGTDLSLVCRKLQPSVHARLSVWDSVPVVGSEAAGSRCAYEKAAKYLLEQPETAAPENRRGYLVLGLSEADWNGIGDLGEIKRMMDTYFHLPCLNDSDGRYRLQDLKTARWILAATPEAVPLAKAVNRLWNTPWYQGLPYGLGAARKMVEAVEQTLGVCRNDQWESDWAQTEQAVQKFREAIRARSRRGIYLDAGPSRNALWASFLTGELGIPVTVPSGQSSALSTDGAIGYCPEIQANDLILGSGFLCSLYPRNPSLCIAYPVTSQKMFGQHSPFLGLYGVQNLVNQLYCLLTA